ncbi:hypothetical protein AMS68_003858 [Peltaster fructicola]|uniref:DUF7923 domain-containing protein n=1 Tax=Peltaster fructicola TaxID=286661 RepID=A0A6H0XUJ5_9PEZI|nr:hypothetical protein AMS68_003858 [Peltaster fructicola]
MSTLVSTHSQGSPLTLEQRWNTLRDVEDQRNTIIQELFAEFERVRLENERLCLRLDASERAYGISLTESRELTATIRRLTGPSFVFVLIDGDNTLFLDSIVAAGTEGGQRAAHGLQQALKDLMIGSLELGSDTTVLVNIFHNATGFKKTYRDAGIADEATVSDFLRSFNAQLPTIEYIDAGEDSQAADNKMNGRLDFFSRIEGCKQIVFAGSADRGYVGPLRRFTGSPADAARITLIESIPFPQDFQDLSTSFDTVKFDELFRTRKIVVPRTTWATTTARRASPSTPTEDNSTRPVVDHAVRRIIWLNQRGQRIDPPVRFDGDLIPGLKTRRLCSRHFLTHCNYQNCGILLEAVSVLSVMDAEISTVPQVTIVHTSVATMEPDASSSQVNMIWTE